MRTRIQLGRTAPFNLVALREETSFLYRRLADQDMEVLGVGALKSGAEPVFGPLGNVADWTFGHLCYSDHTVDEPLRPDESLPRSRWTVPRWVVVRNGEGTELYALPDDVSAAEDLAKRLFSPTVTTAPIPDLSWRGLVSADDHRHSVERLLTHIQRGDIYEVNYCIEREAIDPQFDPFTAFGKLLSATDAPFAAFHRLGDNYALCMSPERFLAFDGHRVTGEPMKGTRPRGNSPEEDERLRRELGTDPKERSENIMALDVMRHDLSSVAAMRSVQVEELCAVRSFPRVHQMVSTVSARIAQGATAFDVVKAAFPPASMTGAPKESAMRLIREMELVPRGLYSGTLGYFAPDGTADLNVVIRTLLFDARTGRLSLTTGSAITAQCDPEFERMECEVKALSVINALRDAR